MVRHVAIAVLALGCSEVLGIPDGPHLVPSDPAPLELGSSAVSAVSADAGAAVPSPPNEPHGNEESTNARLDLVSGGPANAPSGGVVSGVPGAGASLPPDAGVASVGDSSPAPRCPAITRASISDFTYRTGASATSASFGRNAAFEGGTFIYPPSGSLNSSTVDDNWHLSGTVDTYSGFGLYSNGCQPLDASAFTGIAFSLWGHIDGDRQLVFYAESAAQQISSAWINANAANPTQFELPNSGRCVPAHSRYDGSCNGPRVMLDVTSEPVSVVIPWADFAGGSPVATVDPREITAIAWSLPPLGDTPYGFDIHIDDLRFVVP